MIESFGDKATEDLYHGRRTRRSRRFPPDILAATYRKLDMLNAAHRLDDLRSPPGNRLHKLERDLRCSYSIYVNDQWRVTFQWDGHTAHNVMVTDYH